MDKTTVSVDIGGTFTDIVILQNNKIIKKLKVPTTPRNPEIGVVNGINDSGVNFIVDFVHATTIATNTLLGQFGMKLPRVALITTKGFRDVIEIGRQNRPSLYDLEFTRPRTIVPRQLRFELDERTDFTGKILKSVEKNDVSRLIEKIRKFKPESVAISFLHSYLNDQNEEVVRNELFREFRYVSVSSSVAPEPREYERTSTTVINGALMPVISEYLSKLRDNLTSFGSPPISVMSNSGGLIDEEEAGINPVAVIESGPAAGVVAASIVAAKLGISRIISFDMGGTTAKAGTVTDGRIEITSEYEVGGKSHYGRMIKGSGYPVRYPFVDLAEVSAGGGTVIWLDSAGGMNIGPMSAGSDPGPVAYNRGGKLPTITDANLVLGILNEKMSGSNFSLRKDLAMKALGKLGDPVDVALKALNLVDLEMSRAIRMVTVERGIDPSEHTLFAFGGAGPQHAARIAQEMGLRNAVIPPDPGVFSALGLLNSDWKYEMRKSFPEDVQKDFRELEEALESRFRTKEFDLYADCRYAGQGSEITVKVSLPDRKKIVEEFIKLHREAYGFTLEREVEIFTIRAFGIERREKPAVEVVPKGIISTGYRNVYSKKGFVDVPVYQRSQLPPGTIIEGLALVDEPGSTTYIPENWTAEVGKIGELNLKVR
ncbi:N-methylhydantoinase A [Cuniculiplasma divulgatum]|uniref:N-methylhydantoinase A n=2 Tax=Cuniculiplasma divulgatum TaxID=1673428 RepID=A0A1R4A6G1_9ARCH|nr:N-methylhydantoinase A [Cuniculiplasma divulgatum]